MTREWLLKDDGVPAEEVVRMMFDAMPEVLRCVFLTGDVMLASMDMTSS